MLLVGREREQRAIDALLDSARDERSAVLVLRGEPGIGKSALLEYAIARADRMQLLRSVGIEAEHEMPFAGVHQLLRAHVGLIERLPAPQAAALRSALGLSFDDVRDRFLISLAVLSLLAEACEAGPLLCVVDDAQWLDRPSADALVFAARRLQAEPIALLIAARDGDVRRFEAPGLDELPLAPLGDGDAHALLAARLDAAPPADVIEKLLTTARGNPLALLELPQALSVGQLEGIEPILGPPPVRGAVEAAFGDRVAVLPDGSRLALLVAALDEVCELHTVELAAERLGVSTADLEPAERAGLVRVDGEVSFRHPLVRSAVYRRATRAERRAAHEALAAVLADPVRRTWHRALVADRADEPLATELDAAGAQAVGRGAHASAAAAFERAAELTEIPARRARRLRCAAQAAFDAGRLDAALAIAERAQPLVGDPVDATALDFIRLRVATSRGAPADAYPLLVGALPAITEIQPERAVLLAIAMVIVAGMAGWPERGIADARRAIARIDSDDGAYRFVSAFLDGATALLDGEAAVAGRLLAQANAIADGLEGEGLLSLHGLTNVYVADFPHARECFEDHVAKTRAAGLIADVTGVSPLVANVDVWERRAATAEATIAEGMLLTRQLAFQNQETLLLAELARVDAFRGREADCREHASDALRRALAHGLNPAVNVARLALGELEVGLGRPREALEHLDQLRPTPFPPIAFLATPDIVDAALRLGETGRALNALDRLESWAPVSPAPLVHGMVARCRAMLAADTAEAEELFRATLDLQGSGVPPFERARTHLAYGERLRRERRRSEARTQLRDALGTFEGIGAELWAERARGELRATGETARRRDASTIDDLTPQELRIAQLVGAGASNREVGAQLFVSPKTVEYHLRKVFLKLGVASRVELAGLRLAGSDQGSD
jgi:DNA-binding CsgD family transcriptional regulator/tetratricopeptide (TPR) repeat protein